MESLAAFLPIDRRRALSVGQTLPDRVRGAALFADISGFTPLTAELARELGGRQGAERIVAELNRVFAPLIAEVHRYRGDVITFNGDAITCWFDDGEADAGAARAAACAFEFQRIMAAAPPLRTPAGATIPIAVKVAIAAGPARRFLAGDPAYQSLEVLAGETLDRMAEAERNAGPGEVIVSAEALPQLPGRSRVKEWRAGRRFAVLAEIAGVTTPPPPEPIPPVSGEVARAWLLPPVYAQLSQGAEGFVSDLRPSISLFIAFSGIDYDGDDDAGRKLDAFIRHVQTVLARFEGFLLQLTMGDKGSYLYAAFGAPIAHENDPGRAAAAALALRELPPALDFITPLKMGISRGVVNSGAYGGPERRTYGVIGSQVNISARLMAAAAPGQVLISSQIADAVGAEFALQALPPIRLKGIEGPFPVWEVAGRGTGRGTGAAPSQLMVGRETERVALEDALAGLMAGESSTLLVEGPAGIGKSVLIQELLAQASAAGTPPLIVTGSGDAIDQATPYHAWQPIFGQLLGLETTFAGGLVDPDKRDEVLGRLDPDSRRLAPLLNGIVPLGLAENEATEQMAAESRQENTVQLLLDLLRSATGGRPLLLVIDDAYWLDSLSWALIRRVQREVQPLLLMLASRPQGSEAPAVYLELRGAPATRLLALDTLSRPAIEELVCRRLGANALPAAVATLIHEKAEGNPFFSEELAYALRDGGLIEVVDGDVRLTHGAADLSALDFPNTIQGIITSRIDLLPPQQQLTVKVASVIGRIFAFRVLRDIYPLEREFGALRANLEALERLDITPLETPEPNLSHIFKHIVTQEVVYSLMTYAQRRELHHRAAVWYEEDCEGDPKRLYALLAHHWRLAGEPAKAATYYELAGEGAVRDYANLEAIRFLTEADTLAGPETPALLRARWQRQMGEAAYRLTLIEQSQTYYRRALELLSRPVPSSTASNGAGLTVEMARQGWTRALPKRTVGRAAPEEREALLEASRVYEGVSEIYYNIGDFLAAFRCVMSAFNLAEKAGPSPELVRGYANMCATLGTVGLNGPAESYRRRAVETAASVDDPSTTAWIQIPLSIYSLWIGAWGRAEGEIAVALDIYSRLGEWRRWCVAAWLWPQVAQSRGELLRGQQLWGELYDIALRTDDTRHQVRSRGGQFFNYLSLGQLDEALGCVESVGKIVAANPEMAPVEERLWHAINALTALHRGDAAGARAAVREQLAAIGRARFKFDLLEVFAAPAEVFLTLQERGEATAREAAQAVDVLNGYARTYGFARPRALRFQGKQAWLAGETAKARKLWERSAAQAEQLGMPCERAMTLREMGRNLNDVERLAQADSLFAGMGCDISTLAGMD